MEEGKGGGDEGKEVSGIEQGSGEAMGRAHLTADVSLPNNILLAKEQYRFNGESQKLCKSYFSVLEQWNLQEGSAQLVW